jgi:phosphate starvation-inducible PhoH-like protein
MAEKAVQAQSMQAVINIFGAFDENMKALEKELDVTVVSRETEFKILGEEEAVEQAAKALEALLVLAERGDQISVQTVSYVLALTREGKEQEVRSLGQDVICITAKGKPIKAKTIGQKKYMEAMRKNTITMGIGPAGTGKTYLAVAAAVTAFREKKVSRIILTRPAVEAGEKLGFLPGDLQSKVDPYLRPLYDGLFEMMGHETYTKNLERGCIEVAPLAYMRGRTLDDSFIILDEAQNTTPEQMKMFLTRIGFGSQAVVTGDITQIDLPDGKNSGLKEALRVLRDVEGIAQCFLTDKDVVRHELVQRIVKAYAKYEETKKEKQEKKKRYFKQERRGDGHGA